MSSSINRAVVRLFKGSTQRPLSPATVRLHRTLIRLLKGCLTAWEKWLDEEVPGADQHDRIDRA